ncbi:MAG TPA: glycosyltransferase family 4 protein [Abditibacterium sp.]|jgi:glycosyltransferase involved in cell wall biosynthesis
MHIFLTADCVGGVWTYALDLVRALPHHRFSIATMGARPSKTQREAVEKLPNAQLFESDWKLEWQFEPWHDVAQAGQWLLQLERDLQPDIVHLNGFSHGALPFRAPKIVVAHSCVLSWWRAVKGENAPPEWNFYRDHVAAGLRGADVVVSPTRALLKELQLIYGDFAPSRVIWNGASLEAEIEAKSPFVLAAGRLWDEAKNIALLDEVAPQIEWPIRVAGQSQFENEGFAAQNLDVLGALEPAQMKKMMREAAIWAHPARYEPFGLATLEAAQSGCALVLSDIPTLRELWDGAALFASPREVSDWKVALQNLVDDENSRLKGAKKAQARAQNYSLERFGASYEALYSELKMDFGK